MFQIIIFDEIFKGSMLYIGNVDHEAFAKIFEKNIFK